MPRRKRPDWDLIPRYILLYCTRWLDDVEQVLGGYSIPFNKKILFLKDLENIAKFEGIKYYYSDKLPDKFSSNLYKGDNVLFVVINNKKTKKAKWFVFAHELGHHYQCLICNEGGKYFSSDDIEFQADLFAYHCFLPDAEMEKVFKVKKGDGDKIIKEIYRTSIKKLEECDKIDELGEGTKENIEDFSEFMYQWYVFRQMSRVNKYYELERYSRLRENLVDNSNNSGE